MNEQHIYGMHSIDLELIEIKTGRYRWLYFIDGDHMNVGPGLLQAEDMARDDALLFARLAIDDMELRQSRAAMRKAVSKARALN